MAEFIQLETRRAEAPRRLDVVRSEPFRLFLPLGIALTAGGVGHWLLFLTGLQSSYSGKAHALAQVQGFLPAFACGFLLTLLPRRTQTRPMPAGHLAVLAAALVVTTVASLLDAWRLAEAAALVIFGLLLVHVLERLRGPHRPPDAFVLIPIALGGAIAGAALLLGNALGHPFPGSEGLGRGLLQEATFLLLACGVSSLVAPLLFGHAVPPDAAPTTASRRARLAHAAAGLALLASYPLEQVLAGAGDGLSAWRIAYGLRFAIVAAELAAVGAFRWPAERGLQRRLLWLAFVMTPLGLLLASAFPSYRVAALHVTFVGGFGLMVLAVGCHVILGHGGHLSLVHGSPWPVRVFGALVVLSLGSRVGADLTPQAYWAHVAFAAGLWLAAAVAWAAFLVPKALDFRGAAPRA